MKQVIVNELKRILCRGIGYIDEATVFDGDSEFSTTHSRFIGGSGYLYDDNKYDYAIIPQTVDDVKDRFLSLLTHLPLYRLRFVTGQLTL